MDHERAVFMGDPGCLGEGVETLFFLVRPEVVPFVLYKGKHLYLIQYKIHKTQGYDEGETGGCYGVCSGGGCCGSV